MVSKDQAKQRMKRPTSRKQAKTASEAVPSKPPQSSIPASTREAMPATPTATQVGARQRVHRARPQIAHGVDLPAVAPCKDLETLRQLTPNETRHHVNSYLHSVMPAEQAGDFDVLAYRWELHLVELDHIQLLRQVDMNRRKLSRYRTALRKGASFPPLVALGGDGAHPTEGVLLCDGYHRIVAMRDIGLNFAWVWLAVDLWREQARVTAEIIPVLSGCRV